MFEMECFWKMEIIIHRINRYFLENRIQLEFTGIADLQSLLRRYLYKLFSPNERNFQMNLIKMLKFQRDMYYFLLELLDKYSHIYEHMSLNVSKLMKYKTTIKNGEIRLSCLIVKTESFCLFLQIQLLKLVRTLFK